MDHLQQDLDDARSGWESSVEYGRDLEKQREELLAAAKLAHKYLTCDSTPLSNDYIAAELRAAIAKCETK